MKITFVSFFFSYPFLFVSLSIRNVVKHVNPYRKISYENKPKSNSWLGETINIDWDGTGLKRSKGKKKKSSTRTVSEYPERNNGWNIVINFHGTFLLVSCHSVLTFFFSSVFVTFHFVCLLRLLRSMLLSLHFSSTHLIFVGCIEYKIIIETDFLLMHRRETDEKGEFFDWSTVPFRRIRCLHTPSKYSTIHIHISVLVQLTFPAFQPIV